MEIQWEMLPAGFWAMLMSMTAASLIAWHVLRKVMSNREMLIIIGLTGTTISLIFCFKFIANNYVDNINSSNLSVILAIIWCTVCPSYIACSLWRLFKGFTEIKLPPGYTDAEHDENGNPVDEELNG